MAKKSQLPSHIDPQKITQKPLNQSDNCHT
jgi:hypothetical protein